MSYNLAHRRVYAALRQREATQPELARATGLSLPAVIEAVRQLEQRRLLEPVASQQGKGRPAKRVRLTPEWHLVLAFDFGGSSLRAALFDLHGGRLEQFEGMNMVRFSRLGLPDALRHLAELVARFPQVERVGLCVPGVVWRDQVERSWVFGMKTLQKIQLEDALQKPVLLENDARSAGWGEFRAGRGSQNFAFINFSFGIGAGIISDGRLLRGAHGAAGEMSYLPTHVSGFEEKKMGALSYGFFEALRAVSTDPSQPNWEAKIFQNAAAGRDAEQRAVRLAVQHLALALAGIITALDPERIVLREEFPHTRELVLEPLRGLLAGIGLNTELELSALGRDAGLIGAGLLASEALERQLLR
ncbi:MAG: ROK family transcriptional regulator [Deinococcales bacterium]